MKTESKIKPAALVEVEALPALEGAKCTVILYDNIQGPFTKEDGPEKTPETYYTYDRYEMPAIYRAGLKASVEGSLELWIAEAKKAEAAGKQPTKIEALEKEVATLRKENADLNATVDELVIASLGGEAYV